MDFYFDICLPSCPMWSNCTPCSGLRYQYFQYSSLSMNYFCLKTFFSALLERPFSFTFWKYVLILVYMIQADLCEVIVPPAVDWDINTSSTHLSMYYFCLITFFLTLGKASSIATAIDFNGSAWNESSRNDGSYGLSFYPSGLSLSPQWCFFISFCLMWKEYCHKKQKSKSYNLY